MSAVSVGGDGSSRVQVQRGGRRRLVRVIPGLAAEGYVQVRPARGERLRRGHLVIVGRDGARTAPGGRAMRPASRALRASRSSRAAGVARAVETAQLARAERRSRGALRTVRTDGVVVELIGVGRQYGSDPPVIALRDVDLALTRGTSLAIVGPSGSGKSTLMNVLGCLDRPTSGTYLFEGVDVGTLNDDERAALRAHRIGFVFQSFNLLAHRTVLENVMLAEVYRGMSREGRAERALATLQRVGMTERAHFRPPKLSGGEQQRVAIARALMGDHALLLCDEPTGNLDSANTESVLALFDALAADGLTLVMVTHEEQVAQHALRRVHMIDGRLTEEDR